MFSILLVMLTIVAVMMIGLILPRRDDRRGDRGPRRDDRGPRGPRRERPAEAPEQNNEPEMF